MNTEHSKYDLEGFEDGGIVWGAKIDASNYGKPLSWLNDNEEVYCHWGYHTSGGPYLVDYVHGWGEGFQIRLPADHWAYPVIAKGFTPWAGGDGAPGDWEPGSPVLFRNGDQPKQGELAWGPGYGDYTIIGYRKRVEGEVNHAYESRMAERFIKPERTIANGVVTVIPLSRSEAYDDGLDIPTLEKLGLLRYETPIEAFEASHGGLDSNQRDIVEAFIAWQSAQ